MQHSNLLLASAIDGVKHRFELPILAVDVSLTEDDSRFSRIASFIQKDYHSRRILWASQRNEERFASARATNHDIRARSAQVARFRQANAPLPNIWLATLAYRFIRACIEREGGSEIADFFRRQIRNKRRQLDNREDGCAIFQLGMNAIFEPTKESAENAGALCRRDRELIAKQLWHAYRHYVPEAFLEGFLLQCRTAGLPGRAKDGVIEVGFTHWIAVNRDGRFEDEGKEVRGHYPNAIEKRARKLRKTPSAEHPLSSRMERSGWPE